MKKGREYHGRGEEKGKEKVYHLPYNVKAVWKNIKWGKGGRGRKFWGRKSKFKKMVVEKNIKL